MLTHSLELFECIPLNRQDPDFQELTENAIGSNNSWELVSRWLRDCLCTHHAYNDVGAESWFPTRLIDLGDSEQSKARLICSETDLLEGVYATVSYRWGDTIALRLLQHNIDTFRDQILVKCLPPVLCNAVSMARRFRVRYLWIDSLCIIQDCRLDWQ